MSYRTIDQRISDIEKLLNKIAGKSKETTESDKVKSEIAKEKNGGGLYALAGKYFYIIAWITVPLLTIISASITSATVVGDSIIFNFALAATILFGLIFIFLIVDLVLLPYDTFAIISGNSVASAILLGLLAIAFSIVVSVTFIGIRPGAIINDSDASGRQTTAAPYNGKATQPDGNQGIPNR